MSLLTMARAADDVKPATKAAERPTTLAKDQSCATAECHAKVQDFKVLHGPMNVGDCDACHTLANVQEHTFKAARPSGELCTFCHKVETDKAKFVHQPLMNGQCNSCHNPHGGADRFFLRGGTVQDSCSACHRDYTESNKSLHGPVASGACNMCHNAHTAENAGLLRETGRELCLGCHEDMAMRISTGLITHEPVKKDCLICHDPHGSKQVMLIKKPPIQTCTQTCHQDVKSAALSAANQHSAVTRGDGCINCHRAHSSDLAHLMKEEPLKTCLACHKKPIKVNAVRTVAAVGNMANPKMSKHGPVNEGTCGGCHNVHGSENAFLLETPYTANFYEPFGDDKYQLCFSCHIKELVKKPKTRTTTNFRDGDRNLHYLHVFKDKRGRSCRACHETHAGKHASLVRKSVPYGKWELPVNFKPTKTGGTCAAGCHKKLSYDRQAPDYVPPDPDAEDN